MLSNTVSKTAEFRQQTMNNPSIFLQFLSLQVKIEGMASNGKYIHTHTHTHTNTFWLL